MITYNEGVKRLRTVPGCGSFMAAQVVADTKQFDKHLAQATDWWSWAAPGPGSRRGLNRIFGLDINTAWRDDNWLRELRLLSVRIETLRLRGNGIRRLCNQDLQNCLCEFDKYERTRTGEGAPKQLYRRAG